jgi:hypothetical protein
MRIRIKKQVSGNVERLEGFGEIMEVLVNQDFIEPKKVSVSLCFRGKDGAGIIDLTPDEINGINKEISSRKKLLKGVKILKFRK